MRFMTSIPIRVLALVILAFLAACGDEPTAPAPAPGIQPQITNSIDAFSYQITSLDDVTGTYQYSWQNTGTLAKVTHATNAGATGGATVTLSDAEGTEVYSGALATSGEPVSSPAGVSGAWTIRVVYTNYSNAQVNFGVLKQ